jgi:hypothetical protein
MFTCTLHIYERKLVNRRIDNIYIYRQIVTDMMEQYGNSRRKNIALTFTVRREEKRELSSRNKQFGSGEFASGSYAGKVRYGAGVVKKENKQERRGERRQRVSIA